MRIRMVLLLPVLLLGAACSDSAGPVRLVAGEWGGQNIGVTAGPESVSIALACARVQFTGAIAPDASGDFVLRDGKLMGWTAVEVPVSARGHVDGDEMTLVIVVPTSQGTRETSYVAQRDAPAIVTVFCATA